MGANDCLYMHGYKIMGANDPCLYMHGGNLDLRGGHLDLRPVIICTNFQSPFNTRLHMKFEEIRPRGF